MLRQDPDVILVGEIRDEETARTAMQAAMTGHLVFSTVHAKDTISAVFRLLDLKVEPYLVWSYRKATEDDDESIVDSDGDVKVTERILQVQIERCGVRVLGKIPMPTE